LLIPASYKSSYLILRQFNIITDYLQSDQKEESPRLKSLFFNCKILKICLPTTNWLQWAVLKIQLLIYYIGDENCVTDHEFPQIKNCQDLTTGPVYAPVIEGIL